jgi:hypothetical protein
VAFRAYDPVQFLGTTSELSTAEQAELKQTYSIEERKDGRRVFRGRGKGSDAPTIHTELIDGKWVIKDGLASGSNRISNPNTMNNNFEGKFGDKPDDHQTNHLTPDASWQKLEITQAASERGIAGVDDDSNLIAQPASAKAFEDNGKKVKDLEQQDALAKIIQMALMLTGMSMLKGLLQTELIG